MKKMLAILVALLMLALSVASAEEAFTFTDPYLSINMGGEDQIIDLTGMQIQIAGGKAGDVDAAQIDILKDGAKVYGIAVNVVDGKVLVGFDGVSTVVSTDIPADNANMEQLQNLDLSGVNIDTDALMETLMNGIEMEENTIRVPYTTVNELLGQILPALEGVSIPGVDIAQLTDTVNQLKESNSGVTLEGTYTQEGETMEINASAFLVQDGEATGDSLCDVYVTTDGSSFTFAISLMNGEVSFSMAVEGELVTIGVTAQGFEFSLSGKVGSTEADVEFVELDAANAIDINAMTSEQQQQFAGELMEAASELINFVYGALSNEAA